jgi:hypothetical protein
MFLNRSRMSWLIRSVAVLTVVLSAILGFCLPAFAQDGTTTAPPVDLSSLLTWIGAGGGAMIVVSWLCNRWAWFLAQEGDRKSLIILGFSIIAAVVAKLLLSYLPAGVIAWLSPLVAAAISVFSIWQASQASYTLQKSARKTVTQAGEVSTAAKVGVSVGGNVTRSDVIAANGDVDHRS